MASDGDERCPHCGIRDRDFRTGLTFSEVFGMLWSYDDDPSTWKYKRRHTVLGKWRQIKLEWWDYHVDEGCPEATERTERVA